MSKIKVAIVGIGNCASSLIQGIHYYRSKVPDDANRLDALGDRGEVGDVHWIIGLLAP